MVAWHTIPGYRRLIDDVYTRSAQRAALSAETREHAVACEVQRADVDQALVEDVERTVRLASRTLGLDPEPRLRWLPAGVKGLRGVVFDESLSEIWVKVQASDATRETALHELRHVWQLRADRYKSLGLLSYEQRQSDADEFARTWSPFDQPAPVAAHAQRSAGGSFEFVRAVDQEAARSEWERKYLPMHEAYREYVAEQRQYRRRR